MDTVLNGGWTNIGSIDRAPAARENLFSRLASKIVITTARRVFASDD